MNSQTKGEVPDGHTLTIKDGDDAITWRAYPGPSTTIAEMMLACHTYGLRVWVDLDGEVCMIIDTRRIGDERLPHLYEIATCMWPMTDVNPDQHTLDLPA